jgi:FO synthase
MNAMSRTLLKEFPHERQLTAEEALSLADASDLDVLIQAAARRRDYAHGSVVS